VGRMNAPLLADVRSHLGAWEERWGAPDEREAAALADARAALEQQPPALLRHPHRTHITCSAFVFSPDLRRTLLVHHLKGNFWVQPGGHPEDGDASVIAAALRETLEETGVRPVGRATVLDLDHHGLSGAFGHCRSHLDLGVAVTADPAAQLLVSDESADVGWFGVDALPELLPSNFAARLARIAERAGRF
jgi:8-oxo-dGTP pyrophosphatase MutT (NUDIX family)